uniref:Nonstructural protein n=1 Tax=Dulem virus 100 TaxID=3145577 RepID=A0AAU8B7S5_9VIRU
MKIVTVKDRAVDAYSKPIFVRATGEAARSFVDEINNDNSEMGKHPEDYDLYLLGEYDERTGGITSEPIPALILRGQDVKNTA